jgi:hypothetical protein
MIIPFRILTNIEGWHDLYRTPNASVELTRYAWGDEEKQKAVEGVAVEVLVRETGTLAGRDGIIALVGLGRDRDALGRLARALSDAHGPEMREAASTVDEARSRQLLEPLKKTCFVLQLAQFGNGSREKDGAIRPASPRPNHATGSQSRSSLALTLGVVAMLGMSGLVAQQIWRALAQPEPLRLTISDEEVKRMVTSGAAAWMESVAKANTSAGSGSSDHSTERLDASSRAFEPLSDVIEALAEAVNELAKAIGRVPSATQPPGAMPRGPMEPHSADPAEQGTKVQQMP